MSRSKRDDASIDKILESPRSEGARPVKLVLLDDQITPYRIPFFERLAQDALDLTILYCSPRFPERQWRLPHELRYKHEILPHIPIRLTRPPYGDPRTILLNPSLLLRLLRLNPELVVGYSFSVPALTAFLYAKLFRKRFISWSTGTLHTERYLGPVQRFMRRLIIPRADACITPSSSGRKKFIHFGADPNRVKIVVQSADVEAFWQAADRARSTGNTYATKAGLSGRIIVFVGFLSKRKGVDHLIEAFRTLSESLQDATLILVGDGPRKGFLQSKVADLRIRSRVHFAGHIPQDQLPSVYASAHVFALPTLEDTFGVVVSEAASCGLPIVCSKFAGAAEEYVKVGVNGYIVDPRNVSQLAEALLNVLVNEENRNTMAQASLAIARENNLEAGVQSLMEAVHIACNGVLSKSLEC